MSSKQVKRQKQAKTLRTFRKVHRTTGALLFVVFFVVAITGLLLGWKSHSGGWILPDTQDGTTQSVENWQSYSNLIEIAQQAIQDSISTDLDIAVDRIDVRPDKGVLKFTFKSHHWEVQLDGATGAVLGIAKRYSDLFEDLHDGSILDDTFGTPNKILKLIYTSIIGLSLLLFTITGFWLWYGPKRMRQANKANSD